MTPPALFAIYRFHAEASAPRDDGPGFSATERERRQRFLEDMMRRFPDTPAPNLDDAASRDAREEG